MPQSQHPCATHLLDMLTSPRRPHYNTTIRSIIPLPDPGVSPSNPAHISFYEDQPRGAAVLAMYPETTSFYRATVLSPPIPGTGGARSATSATATKGDGSRRGKYVLRFDDDGDKAVEVDAGLVVEVRGLTPPAPDAKLTRPRLLAAIVGVTDCKSSGARFSHRRPVVIVVQVVNSSICPPS